MHSLRSIVILLSFAACASVPAQRTESGRVDSSRLVREALLRKLGDATSVSLDQFLNVYLVERAPNRLLKLSFAGDSLRAMSGYGSDHYQFNDPVDVDARQSNAIYIADRQNHRIEAYTKELAYASTLFTRDRTDATARFGYPQAVASDDAGSIYLSDGENKQVVKVRPDYTIERRIGGFSEATRPEGILTNPGDIAVDGDERLFVLDRDGGVLVGYDRLGNALGTVALQPPAFRIAASNDTVFALSKAGAEINLFRSPTLAHIGKWELDADDHSVTDFAVRNGAVVLLERKAVYRCRVVH